MAKAPKNDKNPPPAPGAVAWDLPVHALTEAQMKAEVEAIGDPLARRTQGASDLGEAFARREKFLAEIDAEICELQARSESALWNGQRELERLRLIGLERAKRAAQAEQAKAAAAATADASSPDESTLS